MFDRTKVLKEMVGAGTCRILAGNAESRVFIDLRTRDHPGRRGPLTPTTVNHLAGIVFDLILEAKLELDAIAGVPLAGEPFAKALQGFCGRGIALIRLAKVSSQGERRIEVREKATPKKRRVLLVNEVIDRGQLTRKAACALWSQRFEVVGVATIVDRCVGGERNAYSGRNT